MLQLGGSWREGHPWASFYDFMVERERFGGALWRMGVGSDLRLLYETADAVGEVRDAGAVLDVPCGGGVALRGLRPGQKVRYVAADISPQMLERTRLRALRFGLDQVELVEADVERLPFGDATFDLCISLTGLHCFPRPAAAVKEIARCLKPGAILRGSALLNDTGVRYEPMRAFGRAAGLMGPGGTTAELADWAAEAGLVDLTLRRSGAIVYFAAMRGRAPAPAAAG